MNRQSQTKLNVFIAYAHEDVSLCEELVRHLAVFERQGLIRTWHDRQIGAGQEWAGEIDANLDAADLVLLLVSPDFVASDYCWDVEARRALERYAANQALVIPVVLRPVDFADAPFGKLQALPRDARPVTLWDDRDEAFRDVALGLRAAIEEEQKRRAGEVRRTWEPAGDDTQRAELRLRRHPVPDLPEQPYPLLLPYTHPALLGGRDRDLARLRRSLRQPIPILGLYAPSGIGKSSLLLAGLVPALRDEETPVALSSHPHEPGLARRLLDDLTEDCGPAIDDDDWQGFVERLCEVEDLAGKTPILIVDQLEDVLRRAYAGTARAALGVLLAATVRRRPEVPCRWLLSYREEYHGEVLTWLHDVLAEARTRGLEGIEVLPHDLVASDRFHARSLAPLGFPLPGSDPLSAATEDFLAAIEAPLSLTGEDSTPRYPWRFAPGSAERLARAFAEARVARPEAPLTPELQVVLANLLARAERGVIEVSEDPGALIDEALEDHLRRALEATFPNSQSGMEQRRARALLALRELATATGQRDDGLSATQLAQAIGEDGEELLEQLATPLTRLVIAQDAPDGMRYVLSHDRMAEAVVRVVETEGGQLMVDAELLNLRRFVALETAVYRSGQAPAPRLPRRHFFALAANADALLWDEEHRAWWAACCRRRRADRWRAAVWSLTSGALLALIAFGVWSWAAARATRRSMLDQVAQGEPEAALQALDWLRREEVEDGELRALLGRREVPSAVLERGLGGLGEAERSAAVLAAVGLMLPFLEESPKDPVLIAKDPVLIANLVWALDYAPARDPPFAARARELREQVLAPIRRLRPPPPLPDQGDPDWIEVPAGSFLMGTGENEEGNEHERPRHQVTVSAFRLQRHEVTNGEYRRLVPAHQGEEDLPAGSLSWYEAYTYAAWLGGRLPTEAEWEYAARAGCAHRYCDRLGRETTVDAVAWTRRNSRDVETGELAAREVMLLGPNPWGLYDMLGNLWEWTADWYDEYSAEPQMEPWGPAGPARSSGARVLRGACFVNQTVGTRAADRSRNAPGNGIEIQGLRVMLPSGRPVVGQFDPAD